ncbi:hypothetical protein AKJ09_02423 [Labilithrix luteola]|uniref:Uncharacterized protein n=1 Tax=Labilithrix luteola TaxID=1391654 RepID=A0A0K1PRM8_9BACT|nr:hypothetical protein AKJ09_02423 [Labilithrix luteola]
MEGVARPSQGACGHLGRRSPDAMRVRYSTAATPEVAKAIGKVVRIAPAKPRAARAKKTG